MNQQYWDDLVYEGEKLSEIAEGTARDLSEDIEPTVAGRASTRIDAEQYRASKDDHRPRNPNRPEHQLQDVIDAYRWNHPGASDAVPRNIGYKRPGR